MQEAGKSRVEILFAMLCGISQNLSSQKFFIESLPLAGKKLYTRMTIFSTSTEKWLDNVMNNKLKAVALEEAIVGYFFPFGED